MLTRARLMALMALAAGALILAGCGSSSSSSAGPGSGSGSGASATSASSSTSTSASSSAAGAQIGFEGIPIEQGAELGPASTTQTGAVDGIQCGAIEQLAYHIHAHLAVYVNGTPRTLPAGIGIPGSQAVPTSEGPVAAGGQCIYWLHTHAPDGVIHVESPTQRTYTLGNFFDEWHQPLTANSVGSASGKVTAVVDGKRWTKSPRAIPLVPHTVIQLSVGTPVVAFKPVSWAGTQL